MITEEIYKKISGFDFIEVSNLGNVRNIGGYFVILSTGKYPTIRAQKEILSPIIHKPIHIIVADLFLGRREEIERRKREKILDAVLVCHIDDNPKNNRLDNLYLGTSKTNAEDARRNRFLKK